MRRVLIVDDAAFMRASLRLMLERNGYQVVGEAENGAVGVRKFIELTPDITTMDITMPEMNGLEALKEIRRIKPDAKVIMVSAMGQEPLMKEAVMLGVKAFIVKPFKEQRIISVFNSIA